MSTTLAMPRMGAAIEVTLNLAENVSVRQSFHPTYFKEGELDPAIERFAISVHRALICAQQCDGPIYRGSTNTDGELAVRARMRAAARASIPMLQRRSKELVNGEFVFTCEQKDCSRHPDIGGRCEWDGDIRVRLIALPTAHSCASFAGGKIK